MSGRTLLTTSGLGILSIASLVELIPLVDLSVEEVLDWTSCALGADGVEAEGTDVCATLRRPSPPEAS